jgi:hypothetical protein
MEMPWKSMELSWKILEFEIKFENKKCKKKKWSCSPKPVLCLFHNVSLCKFSRGRFKQVSQLKHGRVHHPIHTAQWHLGQQGRIGAGPAGPSMNVAGWNIEIYERVKEQNMEILFGDFAELHQDTARVLSWATAVIVICASWSS